MHCAAHCGRISWREPSYPPPPAPRALSSTSGCCPPSAARSATLWTCMRQRQGGVQQRCRRSEAAAPAGRHRQGAARAQPTRLGPRSAGSRQSDGHVSSPGAPVRACAARLWRRTEPCSSTSRLVSSLSAACTGRGSQGAAASSPLSSCVKRKEGGSRPGAWLGAARSYQEPQRQRQRRSRRRIRPDERSLPGGGARPPRPTFITAMGSALSFSAGSRLILSAAACRARWGGRGSGCTSPGPAAPGLPRATGTRRASGSCGGSTGARRRQLCGPETPGPPLHPNPPLPASQTSHGVAE